jgi:RNA polymerase sigma-70 factor (ECF subfamily)
MCRTDRECIEYCLDGRPDAFRHLVGRYQAVLLSYLAGQLANRERAEEAAQEAFVRAYFALNKIERPESFFSWLLGIASRVVKEQRRTERRHRVIAAMMAAEAGPPKRTSSPPASLSNREGVEMSNDFAMERAIGELPDVYREVVLLRYYAGRSCVQVGEDLDIPLGTVTKRLSRAYAMLRESLAVSEHSQERPEVRP